LLLDGGYQRAMLFERSGNQKEALAREASQHVAAARPSGARPVAGPTQL
jgi:hypothetical protein